MHRAPTSLTLLALAWLAAGTGCSLILPQVADKPVIRNPFPQLSRVAVAPFFNQSDEPTVDGRGAAMAYYAELQSVQGFDVVPVGVVEEAMIQHQIDLSGPGEARRLAKILGVDAVAVGSITDYSPYYPPRIGLRVEWYAANPGFHEIPAGYGLPFGTPEEEFIPDDLVYEAELARAKAEFAELTPDCDAACQPLPAPPVSAAGANAPAGRSATAEPTGDLTDPTAAATTRRDPFEAPGVQLAQAQEPLPTPAAADVDASEPVAAPLAVPAIDALGATVTAGAIDMTGACPATAQVGPGRPPCLPQHGPVLSHTQIYFGDDVELTQALEGYAFFNEDRRLGGWDSFLRRPDDFMRFCCHLHISEMLSARGGARKSEVVYRWSDDR
ncbi:MAG: hypothetical protein KDA44_07800 [Planctomycetales bacterium]|nr:hypothetical protein [Planctomycetales bacterium]